ncbi:hypothetical protein AV530_016291 [Patagioenas fasciata monilis]|uniref:Uncharacterized protein n=1 Tax=Patagioenas fasciata monilis TaxID=372326 RepID=A0A1V4JWP7_PATFA|nr:hypothetical protein AV530_016291 [Patagioenas fasciata monilis]
MKGSDTGSGELAVSPAYGGITSLYPVLAALQFSMLKKNVPFKISVLAAGLLKFSHFKLTWNLSCQANSSSPGTANVPHQVTKKITVEYKTFAREVFEELFMPAAPDAQWPSSPRGVMRCVEEDFSFPHQLHCFGV